MSATPPATTTPSVPVSVSRAIPPTDFDNRLLRDVKLKELPRFLWQNAGYNGLFRFCIFVERKFSSLAHFSFRHRYPLLAVGFFMIPGICSTYIKNKRVRDAYIYAKYGEEFEKFDEIEKARIRQQVTNYLNENR